MTPVRRTDQIGHCFDPFQNLGQIKGHNIWSVLVRRASIATFFLALSFGLSGCQQGSSTSWRPTLPWQSNASLANSQRRPLFQRPLVDDLQRRSEEQARLLKTQQDQLVRLRDLQSQYEKQWLAAQQQKRQTWNHQIQQKAQQEQVATNEHQKTVAQFGELKRRAELLDANNHELHNQLAQSQQQLQLAEDQNSLLRDQLSQSAQQLTQLQQSFQHRQQMTDNQIRALQASTQKRPSATITANNSLRKNLTAVTIPGMDVQQDGDLVRISLPSDQMFQAKTATLLPASQAYVDRVADVLRRYYGSHMVGVEVHTDSDPVTGSLWRNSHQLTAAQAMAIFEQLTHRHQLDPRQLFVLGHGANHPRASNGTADGKRQNRRVQIVVYPETVSR